MTLRDHIRRCSPREYSTESNTLETGSFQKAVPRKQLSGAPMVQREPKWTHPRLEQLPFASPLGPTAWVRQGPKWIAPGPYWPRDASPELHGSDVCPNRISRNPQGSSTGLNKPGLLYLCYCTGVVYHACEKHRFIFLPFRHIA